MKDKIVALENGSNFPVLVNEDKFRKSKQIIETNAVGGDFQLERVSLPAGKGKQWEIDGEAFKELTCVIIHKQEWRRFYKSNTPGDEVVSPDCVSLDCVNGRGNPGGICERCPMAEWGSAVDQKGNPTKGQACKVRLALTVLLEGDALPVILDLPSTSIRVINRLFMTLGRNSLLYHDAVVSLGIETREKPQPYAVITGEFVRPLKEQEIKSVAMFNKLFSDAEKVEIEEYEEEDYDESYRESNAHLDDDVNADEYKLNSKDR